MNVRSPRGRVPGQYIAAHRSPVTAEVLASDVFEHVGQLVTNGLSDCIGDADACRLGQRRNAHGYVADP